MLRDLYIQNVQGYKEAFVQFHPGVNMIIGGSDKGKSALFNSIYKVAYNRPLGSDWQSWWGGTSIIKLGIEDFSISLEKQKNKSAFYQINYCDADPIKLPVVGRSVPEQVSQLLNLDKKVNIQQQLERGVPIFLIAESPGDVAKHFNKVAGLYKIDSTLAAGKSDVKAVEKQIKEVTSLIDKKKKELKKYEKVKQLKSLVYSGLELEDLIKINTEKAEDLRSKIKSIKAKQNQLQQIKEKLKIKNPVKKASVLYNKRKKKQQKIERLKTLLNQITDYLNRIDQIEKRLEIRPFVERAIVEKKARTFNKQKAKKLSEKRRQIVQKQKQLDVLDKKLIRLRKKYKTLMPDICPFCGK